MFTAQHYIKVAEVIRGLRNEVDKKEIADAFKEMFEKDNLLFNSTMFIEACFDEDWG